MQGRAAEPERGLARFAESGCAASRGRSHATALAAGAGWALIGIVYLAFISRGFSKMPKTVVINLDDVE